MASGTYKASLTSNQETSFHLKKGVAIYGGFAGTEVILAQRTDTTGSTTILSGDLGNGFRSRHIVQALLRTKASASIKKETASMVND